MLLLLALAFINLLGHTVASEVSMFKRFTNLCRPGAKDIRSWQKVQATHTMSSGAARFKLNDQSSLLLYEGDLTKFSGDAIVNAANERMLGGGGVDGAIHRAAGPDLVKECKKVAEVSSGVRCPTGEARITGGFKLAAKHVIHTVGPIYRSAQESAPLLANAYKSSLALANEHGLKTVAFPAISTGVFGYPIGEAAEVSLAAVVEAVGTVEEVHFILFGAENYGAVPARPRSDIVLEFQRLNLQDLLPLAHTVLLLNASRPALSI
eukprot:gene4004-14084_t